MAKKRTKRGRYRPARQKPVCPICAQSTALSALDADSGLIDCTRCRLVFWYEFDEGASGAPAYRNTTAPDGPARPTHTAISADAVPTLGVIEELSAHGL